MRTMLPMTFVAAIALCCLLGGAKPSDEIERAKKNLSKHQQALKEATKELDKIPFSQRQREMERFEDFEDSEQSEEDEDDSSNAPPTIVLMNKIEAETENTKAAREALCQICSVEVCEEHCAIIPEAFFFQNACEGDEPWAFLMYGISR
eukprot:gnl/TRDRNA2_/TRDRNA2_174488_c0_seq1.p1 gnl/TRDRNA2_/TRDRNA2_174488_c0~~gnl/TRDRNA2_/TRDRNA2_174488_c0_seq1.p1  ORF type:complete len:149 (-),score=29.37 gnl/TRDRNA2_/TRDRNA2_174488_c0_seq1:2-448(-)